MFQPGSVHLWAGAADAGTGAYEGRREGGFGSRTFHGITPETEHTSHYFWSAAHNFRLDEPGVLENHYAHLNATFEEDRVILEAQYEEERQQTESAAA